jgi:hypothetical protein
MDKTMKEQALEHYEKGRQKEDKGQYTEALDEYSRAMLLDVNENIYKDAYNRISNLIKANKEQN